jgi:hypothetical protein
MSKADKIVKYRRFGLLNFISFSSFETLKHCSILEVPSIRSLTYMSPEATWIVYERLRRRDPRLTSNRRSTP